MIFNDFGEIPGILMNSRNLQTIFRDFQLFRKVSNEFQRFEAPDVLARLPTCWQGHMHWTRPRDASLLKPTPWTTAHLIDLMWPTPLHRWQIPSIPNHSNFSSGHFVIIFGPEILPYITILKLIGWSGKLTKLLQRASCQAERAYYHYYQFRLNW